MFEHDRVRRLRESVLSDDVIGRWVVVVERFLFFFFDFFFFNDTATTEIYTLSLHDALPIC